MSRFRKKPVEIEARQWDGSPGASYEITLWVGGYDQEVDPLPNRNQLGIKTLEGWIYASPGDWIIRGVAGEFYPCKPDIFEATYESADDDAVPMGQERLA